MFQKNLHTNNVRKYKGGFIMKRSIMSENLKDQIARELGVYDTVKNEGWGSVSSRNCGNLVKKAIEIANETFK